MTCRSLYLIHVIIISTKHNIENLSVISKTLEQAMETAATFEQRREEAFDNNKDNNNIFIFLKMKVL